MLRKLLTMGLLVTLVACASKSPQLVPVEPDLVGVMPLTGDGELIALTVTDSRDSDVLGSRGGAYPETALIRLKSGFETSMKSAIEGKLEEAGFSFTDAGSAITWKVMLSELTYSISEKTTLKDEVKITGAIDVEIVAGNKTFTNFYKANYSKEILNSPSDEKNVEMINGVISQLITLMLEDESLAKFL